MEKTIKERIRGWEEKKKGKKRMGSVYILGAGASREYAAVKGRMFWDADFFVATQAMWRDWFREGKDETDKPYHYDGSQWHWPSLKEFVESHFQRPITKVGLEEAFRFVDGTEVEWQASFCRCIELTLFYKIRKMDNSTLELHLKFLRRLRPEDTIITFNYDPFIEKALILSEGKSDLRWNPYDGYGLTFRHKLAFNTTEETKAAPFQSNVQILKLHGSMNWLSPASHWPSPPTYLLQLLKEGDFGGPGYLCKIDHARANP